MARSIGKHDVLLERGYGERAACGSRNDGAVVLALDRAEPDRLPDQRSDALWLHWFHDLRAIRFDGADADVELRCDCLAGKAVRDQIKHLDLAWGEPREAFSQYVLRLLGGLLLERA